MWPDIKTTLCYRTDRSVQTDGTVFVHCCCEHGSFLSKPVNDKSLTMLDVTKNMILLTRDGEGDNPEDQRSWRCFLVLLTVHRWFNVAQLALGTSETERLGENHCEAHRPLGPSLETMGKI